MQKFDDENTARIIRLNVCIMRVYAARVNVLNVRICE